MSLEIDAHRRSIAERGALASTAMRFAGWA